MKFKALIFAVAISPLAFSSEITVSNNIKVLAVDGVETKTSIFSSNKIEVEDGQHQVVVQFSRTFGNEDLLESKPYIFDINVDGHTEIKTDQFRSYSHASNKVDKDLTWFITNSSNEYTITKADTLTGKGFMPYSDIEGLIEEYNLSHNISLNTETKPTKSPNKDLTENTLINEYKLATKEQKKQFKMWLIENETR